MNLTDNGYRWVATPAPLAGRYDDIFSLVPIWVGVLTGMVKSLKLKMVLVTGSSKHS